jgi:hypothetical protein
MVKTVNTNKILNNDFLYKVVVVLALINVIGYIVSKNVNALIMFTFVYLAINYLTKNMTVVLLTAIFATNFFIVGKKVKEAFKEGVDEDDGVKEDAEEEETAEAELAFRDLVSEVEDTNKKDKKDKKAKKAEQAKKEPYDNGIKLQPADIAPVEFNSDSAELTKQLKILNERTKNSMGMINKLGGIGNIGKMVDNLTSIVGKLG